MTTAPSKISRLRLPNHLRFCFLSSSGTATGILDCLPLSVPVALSEEEKNASRNIFSPGPMAPASSNHPHAWWLSTALAFLDVHGKTMVIPLPA